MKLPTSFCKYKYNKSSYVASILQKLEVDDRLQAALKALKERLV